MKANRTLSSIESGSASPCRLTSIGLGIEQIDVRGSAGHEDEDACLCLGVEVRRTGSQRIDVIRIKLARTGSVRFLQQAVVGQHGAERGHPQTAGGRIEELAASSSDGLRGLLAACIHGFLSKRNRSVRNWQGNGSVTSSLSR